MKKIIFLFILVIFVPVAIFVLMGHSVVVFRQEAPARDYEFKTGQKVNPLADFNFDEGSWTAFVVFSNDDRPHLPASIENSTVIHCDDKVVMKELQDQLEFHYTDGDMTTVASRILIFKNDRLMFDSGLVVESDMEGFQSRDFGWIENNNPGSLAKILSKFQRVWSPLVIL
jgi:hypothetical protein